MVITKDRNLNFTDVQGQLTEKQTRLQSLLAKYPQYATAETAKGLTGLTPATTPVSAAPAPEPETPMVKFNRALLDMMDRAQRGVSSVTATQGEVEKTAAEAYRQPYEGQETLTPQQRLGLMETAGEEYKPTIKGLSANIKNFESVLDIVKKTYGDDFQKMLNITPNKETMMSYRRAFQQGEDLSTLLSGLDDKTRQAIFNTLQDSDYEMNIAAKTKTKEKAPIAPTAGDKIYTDKNMPPQIRQDIIDTLTDKEGAKTLGRELTLTDLIKLFPNVDRETLRSYQNEFYDYRTLIAKEKPTAKKWWELWK